MFSRLTDQFRQEVDRTRQELERNNPNLDLLNLNIETLGRQAERRIQESIQSPPPEARQFINEISRSIRTFSQQIQTIERNLPAEDQSNLNRTWNQLREVIVRFLERQNIRSGVDVERLLFRTQRTIHWGTAEPTCAPGQFNTDSIVRQNTLSRAERLEFRRELVERNETAQENSWSTAENETIMRTDITTHFFASVNRLEETYPLAVESTELHWQQISDFIHALNPEELGEAGEWKKLAALAGFAELNWQAIHSGEWYVESAPIGPRSTQQLLNIKELYSLTWAASHDPTVFPTEEIRQHQRIQLVMSIARSGRAHNDTLAGNQIDFNPAIQARPSCARGQVIRSLESLEFQHPDVQLQSHVQAPTSAEIANAELEFARTHERLPLRNSPEWQQAVARLTEQLGRHLVETFPGMRRSQLALALDREIIEALVDQIEMNSDH